jgi:hypothetical protein
LAPGVPFAAPGVPWAVAVAVRSLAAVAVWSALETLATWLVELLFNNKKAIRAARKSTTIAIRTINRGLSRRRFFFTTTVWPGGGGTAFTGVVGSRLARNSAPGSKVAGPWAGGILGDMAALGSNWPRRTPLPPVKGGGGGKFD